MSHPSEQQLSAYRARTLAPAELVSVDGHLAACPTCRRACAAGDTPARAVALAASLAAEGQEHPSAELLTAFAVARLDRSAQDHVSAHLEECDECAEVVAEVRAEFRQAAPPVSMPRATVTAGPRSRSSWFGLAAAATLVLTVGSSALWWATGPSTDAPSTATAVPDQARPAPRISITDGSRIVAIAASGEVSGLDSIGAEVTRIVGSALAAKSLPLPAALAELGARQGHLLSDDTEAAPAALVSPVGVFVSEARPQFEWTLTGAATAVKVELYGRGFELIAESGWLTTTRWAPPVDLPGGGTYSWQLTVRTRTGETFVPKPPASQARFRVLDADGRTRLDEDLKAAANSGLARAVVFARAGLIVNAERELLGLQKANPQSEEISAFLAQLRPLAGR